MVTIKKCLAFVCIWMVGLQMFFPADAFSQAYEEDAEVLPKGVFRFRVDDRIYFPTQTRYSTDGKRESAAADFNANLNSLAFPDLAKVEAGFRLAPGSATVGRSVVDFNYRFNTLTFGLDYGLTDKLTFGVRIPYWFVRNSVSARLDTSTATVGKNTSLNTLAPLNLNLPIPGFRPTVPLTTADVQNLIGRGLDINGDGKIDIPGFGFKRLQTWTGDGLSDIEVGFRYQYLNNKIFRLATTVGARLPTGQLDDINDLADYPFGRGAYALLFRLNNDFIFINNFLWNISLKYDFYLPDSRTLRVPSDADRPLTPIIDRISRKYGNIFEFETTLRYTFLEIWDVSLLYIYGNKEGDRITGNKRLNYAPLEAQTNYMEQIYRVSVGLNTLPLYKRGSFPVPLTFSVQYRDRFAGNNKLLATQYIRVLLNIFF
jgi:hypothetical protein